MGTAIAVTQLGKNGNGKSNANGSKPKTSESTVQAQTVRDFSKKDIVEGLFRHGVIDLSCAKTDAEHIDKLDDILPGDCGGNPIAMAATKLLLIRSLIVLETDYGNDDLSAGLALHLGEILRGCAVELHGVLSRVADTGEPTHESAIAVS